MIQNTLPFGQGPTLQEKFEAFHADNPHVYRLLEDLVIELRQAGVKRIGMELLINQVRWQHYIRTKGSTFKINQNFSSRYARLLVKNHPEWADMFEFRRLRAA